MKLWVFGLVAGIAGPLTADTFTVTHTDDSGPGSLRQALLDSNGNPGLDTIAFNIPGAGVHTISPASALPTITDRSRSTATPNPVRLQTAPPTASTAPCRSS